ncbi:M48 family metallopeptidase [bacterium]|nr:M48 family metallopeptidase [bacterium]
MPQNDTPAGPGALSSESAYTLSANSPDDSAEDLKGIVNNTESGSSLNGETESVRFVPLPSEDQDSSSELRPDIGLLVTDKNGKPASANVILSGASEYTAVTDLDGLFNAPYGEALSEEEKEILLSSLNLFVQSKFASKVLAPQKIVLVRNENKDLKASVYDVSLGVSRELKIPAQTPDGLQMICDMAYKDIGQNLVPVVVNTQSNKYHLPGAEHISKNARLYAFKDKSLARRENYLPCPVCFPEENSYLRQTNYERKETSQGEAAVTSRYRVSQDPESIEKVRKIGLKLLKANDYPGDYCRFVVLDSDEAQAMSLPHGPIFITTGLMNLLETDDELAAVLGHEFAHIILQHGRQSSNRNMAGNILGQALRYTGSYWGYFGGRQAIKLINKGFTRGQEYEADAKGIYYAFAAGFDPNEFCNTLQKLDMYQSQSGTKPLVAWLSDHPSSPDRINNIKKQCEKLQLFIDACNTAKEHNDGAFALAVSRYASGCSDSDQLYGQFRKFCDVYKKIAK